MNWSFLQPPQDGDVLLVWQPPQLGAREASDGYVWADAESAFSSEMRGYVWKGTFYERIIFLLMPARTESRNVCAQDRFPFNE